MTAAPADSIDIPGAEK